MGGERSYNCCMKKKTKKNVISISHCKNTSQTENKNESSRLNSIAWKPIYSSHTKYQLSLLFYIIVYTVLVSSLGASPVCLFFCKQILCNREEMSLILLSAYMRKSHWWVESVAVRALDIAAASSASIVPLEIDYGLVSVITLITFHHFCTVCLWVCAWCPIQGFREPMDL